MAELGYHDYGYNWWSNVDCPESFKYLDLDETYSEEYFANEHHLDEHRALGLYQYMQETYKENFDKYFTSVLEIGGGNGELTKRFQEDSLSFITIEGTIAGRERIINQGIEEFRVYHHDIRRPSWLDMMFDLVICTEVAEHIEPWFASKLVKDCTDRSFAIWFSAANPSDKFHYNHPNEAPIEAWDNIFKFFGYNYVELNGLHDRADRLYIDEDKSSHPAYALTYH